MRPARVIGVAAVVLATAGCGVENPLGLLATTTPAVASSGALHTLATLRVVKSIPNVPGYDRECGVKKGVQHPCYWGQPWTDSNSTRTGHNGCTTDLDVYDQQLTNKVVEQRRGCSHYVKSGTLPDPYTGRTIQYVRGAEVKDVNIDHVYALKAAWNAGASKWTTAKRTAFANDLDLNLIAVDARTNSSKGDQGPETWTPSNHAGACLWATKYVNVSAAYGLPITAAAAKNLRTVLATCH